MALPLKELAGIARLPFLVLTPICVGAGAAVASWRGAPLDAGLLALVLIGALAAHVAVNALNEYGDFKSGLDMETQRTPFSGGSGTLPDRPDLAPLALRLGLSALALTAVLGLYFLWRRGPGILLAGVPGFILAATYTPWVLKNRWLTLIASGAGFGAMVLGTEYVLAGSYSAGGLFAALVVFFLVNNLLLANQFPDMEADRRFGRKNIPITMGPERAAAVMGLFFLLAYASLGAGIVTGALPRAVAMGFLTAPLAWMVWRRVTHDHADVTRLIPALGQNVMLTLVTPLLLGLGLLAAGWLA